ncbi:hypothetical protein QYE76_027885 [Lolium multiflorum]|uniref:F-box domain-containing protein n=1 Tax=Lolium multiflorum TaxID=4521 RepID=A0AAD8QMM4_LOLMU|nr:hypothetical protein QYE76_027885 [Lolium multiflorum]
MTRLDSSIRRIGDDGVDEVADEVAGEVAGVMIGSADDRSCADRLPTNGANCRGCSSAMPSDRGLGLMESCKLTRDIGSQTSGESDLPSQRDLSSPNANHGRRFRLFRLRPWPDLPTELLGLVLQRLQSHADRVRLRAVCSRWRCSERLHVPLLPWLALPDGSFLSFPDAVVHRLRVPNDVSCRLSTGGALFLVHGDGSRSLMSFSSAVTTSPLPEPHDNYSASNIRKVVVSDHLVGVLSYSVSVSTRGGREASIACSTLTMEYWAPVPGIVYNATRDIALFKGKLYILTENDELHVLEAGDQHITAACCIRKIPKVGYVHVERWHDPYATDLYYTERDYLVVSGDRLLWVRRKINIPPILPWDNGIKERTCLFEVFEAADLSSGCG